jgi:hypothetical protein
VYPATVGCVKRQGLFNGWWLDMAGNRIRRIYRNEYPELYRLHRICTAYERQSAKEGRQLED